MNRRAGFARFKRVVGHRIPGQALLALLLLSLWLALAWAVLALPQQSPGVTGQVLANMPDSGVDHPVTAVLLNFRGYDTLLEIGVLLLTAMATMSLRDRHLPRQLPGTGPPGAVLGALVRLLVPVFILVTGYLLWAGKHAPGGAFQAGAVLGAGLILLLLSGMIRLPRAFLRAGLAFGFAVFLLTAAALTIMKGHLLEYPPDQAAFLIMVIETSLTLSIGITIGVLFVVASPATAAAGTPGAPDVTSSENGG